MEECWNFHNNIAIPLEEIGKLHIGKTFPSADAIERGEFVEAMHLVLSVVFGNFDEIPEFVKASKAYASVPAHEIPNEIATELFEDFKRLLKVRK